MIRNAIQRLMYGRYGGDQLNTFMLIGYLVCYLLFALTHWRILYWLSLALIFFTFFRMFSRNIMKRREENYKFQHLVGPVQKWLRLQRTIRKDKEHRYFKCPNCGQQLRVPRGKGTITVTCRGCGASFKEKS